MPEVIVNPVEALVAAHPANQHRPGQRVTGIKQRPARGDSFCHPHLRDNPIAVFGDKLAVRIRKHGQVARSRCCDPFLIPICKFDARQARLPRCMRK